MGIDLSISGVYTDEVFEAMDWLYSHKEEIKHALVARHLGDGSLVCYDLSSS